MQVSATRTISTLAVGGLFLALLFVFVVALQFALVALLRGFGVGGGLALFVSGLAILGCVLGATYGAQAWMNFQRAKLDEARAALGLPEGPCCVVVRAGQGGDGEFPWELSGDVSARFPAIARRCGVEGYAVIDFEVAADGTAKSLHCVDVWPSRIFYESAAAALKAARFRVREGAPPRFGPSYRIPFVFRIKGAARVSDRGRFAIGPALHALRRGAEAAVTGTIAGGAALGEALARVPVIAARALGDGAVALADGLEAVAARLRNLKRL